MLWLEHEERVHWIGHEGTDFCFDNELPRHREYLESFRIRDQLVTCGEYLEFIEDGGYSRDELWDRAGRSWRARPGLNGRKASER